MRKPIIQFKNFTFQYRAQTEPTLHEIDLTIYEGEKVLIAGASGSGKSTLAHCLNGLIPNRFEGESSGELFIKGENFRSQSIYQFSKTVGTVLQDPDNQFIGLTVAEDIAFSLENDCVPQSKMHIKVKEAAQIVDIDRHLSSAPHALSGGQKQRAALAGVLVDQTDILLFDEPLANLDPATGKKTIELIDDIHKQSNKTIIIIEHRIEDVLHRNIDRIIVIRDGRIYADLPPDQLLSSTVLADCGIREPLYITALKYADCKITEAMQPSHIETLQIEACKEPLHNWLKTNAQPPSGHIAEPILQLQNVQFGYSNKNDIFTDLSITIDKGEMVSIVGRNGVGKSTISKLICGFHHPTAGKILLNNHDMKKKSIKERAGVIGMVMQNPNQMISKPHLFDEVALGLRLRGLAEDEVQARVYETLKICGLYPFRNWPISALSFGQKKRVTIAAILVLEPEIIIVDEPTAGQDFKHYTEMMEFLRTLNERGITIIMITHDMHLMLEYTNRTIVLADKQVYADDTPTNILTDEAIIEIAQLKETSLFALANRAELPDARAFVSHFITYDRRMRHESNDAVLHR